MTLPPPSALEHLEAIRERLPGRAPAVFLDYDGTLTPIVERPEEAVLDATMRASVARLAGCCPVAVISGRDLAELRARVGLPGLHYAGSHGFEIQGPGAPWQHPRGVAALPALEAAEGELGEALAGFAGARLERKRFAVAVHFRRVAESELPALAAAVDRVAGRHPGLRRREGKKVVELQPDADWGKGAAVGWLLGRLGLDRREALPICLGDDLTDEDAFEAVAGRGLGVAVLEVPRATAARYRLAGPPEVGRFLDTLAGWLEHGQRAAPIGLRA
jgi:trehalose 6-phosphate phosphatase